MWVISLIKKLGPKDAAIGVLTVIIFLLGNSYLELKKAQTVYENPKVTTVEKIVYREGPVRIKTVIVREAGRETISEDREIGATERTEESGSETAPVPTDVVLKPVRTNRYLLTFGVNQMSLETEGKAVFVGYGINNRLDIQAGAIRKDGNTSPWALLTARF